MSTETFGDHAAEVGAERSSPNHCGFCDEAHQGGVCPDPDNRSLGEAEANARLIADMLEALRVALHWVDGMEYYMDHGTRSVLEDAIRKAEGSETC